jgi:hypothetical protein
MLFFTLNEETNKNFIQRPIVLDVTDSTDNQSYG